jgi:NAD-dependent SIR2 family protein deacetylase
MPKRPLKGVVETIRCAMCGGQSYVPSPANPSSENVNVCPLCGGRGWILRPVTNPDAADAEKELPDG